MGFCKKSLVKWLWLQHLAAGVVFINRPIADLTGELQNMTTGRGPRAGRPGATCGLSLTATLFKGTPLKGLGVCVTVRTTPAQARAYRTARA
jgi:hypothetical protein